jgi:hypothetical protein
MLLAIPGDNTYSNYQEANRVFWRQSVLPLAARIGCSLTHWLAPAFGEGLMLSADTDKIEALSPDRAALWDRVSKAPFLSVNEKRLAIMGRQRAATCSHHRNRNKNDRTLFSLGAARGANGTQEGIQKGGVKEGRGGSIGTRDASDPATSFEGRAVSRETDRAETVFTLKWVAAFERHTRNDARLLVPSAGRHFFARRRGTAGMVP